MNGNRLQTNRAGGFVAALLIWLAAAPSAHAHLMNTGLGPFYDGLTHLFVTPEDLLPAIALALLAGLRGPRFGRVALFVLPLAWLAGSMGGMLFTPQASLPLWTAALTVTLGVLAAADRDVPLALVATLAILLGFLHGGLNGAEMAKGPSSGLAAAGVAVALFVLVALLAGQAGKVRALWMRIAVRIVGSWIAAAGLFMLGWAVRAR